MDTPKARRRAVTSDRVRQDMPAAQIIARFGGLKQFCNATGFPAPTAHGWTVYGLVPAKFRDGDSYARIILEAAALRNIDIAPGDFIENEKPADG